jgi:hypothetical protein
MNFKMEPVPNSSNVAAYGYDAKSKTLRVEFKTGQAYDYSKVPQKTVNGLALAPSKGSYISKHIVKGPYKAVAVAIEA